MAKPRRAECASIRLVMLGLVMVGCLISLANHVLWIANVERWTIFSELHASWIDSPNYVGKVGDRSYHYYSKSSFFYGKTVSAMIRTWRDDLNMSLLAARSAVLFLHPLKEIVFVVEESDCALARSLVEPAFKLVCEPKLLKDGHIQQKYSKLMADTYCSGDYIFHLDSDVILNRMVTMDELFVKDKPLLEYANYSYFENNPDDGIRSAANWKSGTSKALGRPVEFEFSRRNQHIYPRQMYPRLREHLWTVHKMPLEELLHDFEGSMLVYREVLANNGSVPHLLSDFNLMGAFLYYFQPQLMSWMDLLMEEPVLPDIVCQGNARFGRSACDMPCANNSLHVCSILQSPSFPTSMQKMVKTYRGHRSRGRATQLRAQPIPHSQLSSYVHTDQPDAQDRPETPRIPPQPVDDVTTTTPSPKAFDAVSTAASQVSCASAKLAAEASARRSSVEKM